jgi:hypothetical protein
MSCVRISNDVATRWVTSEAWRVPSRRPTALSAEGRADLYRRRMEHHRHAGAQDKADGGGLATLRRDGYM